MDQAIVGKFIQHLRKEHGMTQKQLAGEIGVSDKTISKWENGNGLPDLESLYALSSFFRISINELLAGEKKAADNYQQKAEEVIVDLIKENQKLRGLHIALGVFIGCAGIFIFGIQEFGTSIRSYLPSYFDLSSMLILLMLCYACTLLSGVRGKKKELMVITKLIIPIGAIIALTKFAKLLLSGGLGESILVSISLSLIPMIYSLLIYVISVVVMSILDGREKGNN